LESEADIAVHSMKDVPAHMTPGLTIAAVLKRANPSDAWLAREGLGIDELPPGSTVGTSSLRRQCQLLARRPDLKVTSLRGNVNTRLEKLDRGEYDAIILATAGLDRLGESLRITSELRAPDWLPAPAQGVIGVQCRSGDEATGAMVARLNHPQTAKLTQAERSLSRRLGGSCQLPLAAFARLVRDEMIALDAMVGSSDGHTLLRSQSEETDDPEAAAGSVAEQLLAKGADAIIRAELELASGLQ
jgi:hydroxymethylbilane synthase